jgi:hypothetical protein
MPGRSPKDALDAFLGPLREALSCVARGNLTQSPGALDVGETRSWALNRAEGALLGEVRLQAGMHYEIQDRGASRGHERFKVSTRGYMYAIELASDGSEVMAFHWHPNGTSPIRVPHYHFGEEAIAPSGVFLARAHIPSPRVSFEQVIRTLVEDVRVPALREDWDECLHRTEALFDEHKSWE